MQLSLVNITIDCTDPAALADFWSEVLEHPVDPEGSEVFATIGLRGENRLNPGWLFLAVPEPKVVKNRIHVDFNATDWVAEVERVISLGATRIADLEEHGTQWTTLRDPEGTEFDIGAHTR